MERIDLSRLNPKTFEYMLRQLAFAVFGPTGKVYSSGPDGARDFTVEGNIPGYEARGWSGYLVLQVKFKESVGDRARDLTWLRNQLKTEHSKYLSPDATARRPDYYILASNVSLSGADELRPNKNRATRRGSFSKIADDLSAWKHSIGIQDYDIWGADKICDLLSKYPEIRRSYAAWITSGDVLSAMLDQLQSSKHETKTAIVRSIKRMISREQHVRLRDAGAVDNQQIQTSQVFIDLPLVQKFNERHHPVGTYDPRWTPDGAVTRLVELASSRLDPEYLLSEDNAESANAGPLRSRVVLMGGPGQGKTTATGFLIQIFRAALLQGDPAVRRDPALKTLVAEILKRARAQNIPLDIPSRYPIQVSLPKLADRISLAKAAGTAPDSLLAFIARDISSEADHAVSVSDVRELLGSSPWILVLDGLDEVPPSGERPSVLAAISQLSTEIAEKNADVLIVVTTRPQGYNNDFDKSVWDHWHLAELTPELALAYAKQLGDARYPNDKARGGEVHRVLRVAADQPATMRLMTSPLQVTILHFIVDTGGGVPTARWTLFDEYFEVLKRREKAKGGAIQATIERNLNQLAPIHQRAALVLQTDSERVGGARGSIEHERFARIIRSYLAAEGFSTEEVTLRVDELMELALNRLVLLSTREEGTITFDVRSLQEYMAAAAITAGDGSRIEARLSHIAGTAHWRHVFLIAASRCFAEDAFHYRRSSIVSIARQLDASEPDSVVRNGAKLALDLLADGIGIDHPHSRRPLVVHALDLLQLGRPSYDDRMVTVGDTAAADLIEPVLRDHIRHSVPSIAGAAWCLLFQLAQRGNGWALDLLTSDWERGTRYLDALSDVFSLPLPDELLDIVVSTLVERGPLAARSLLGRYFIDGRYLRDGHDPQHVKLQPFDVYAVGSGPTLAIMISPGKASPNLMVRVRSIAHSDAESKTDQFPTAEKWTPLVGSDQFQRSPSKSVLANVLLDIVRTETLLVAKEFSSSMPWPIATILNEVADNSELSFKIEEVRRGAKGDTDDWLKAERRWERQGISRADLDITSTGDWFNSDVAKIGSPSIQFVQYMGRTNAAELFDILAELSASTLNPTIARTIDSAASFMSVFGIGRIRLNERQVKYIAYTQSILSGERFGLRLLGMIDPSTWKSPECVNIVAAMAHQVGYVGPIEVELSDVLAASRKYPSSREIAYLLGVAILGPEKTNLDWVAQIKDPLLNEQDTDDIRTRGMIGLINILDPMTDLSGSEVDRRLDLLISDPNGDPLLSLCSRVLEGEAIELGRRTTLIRRLVSRLSAADREPEDLYEVLRKALSVRRSSLTDREVWLNELAMPPDLFPMLAANS